MNFTEFKENYLKVHEVQQYPASNFVEHYVNNKMKDIVGTETQLKNKRSKLQEEAKSLYHEMISKARTQAYDIENGYIEYIISEYKNTELAKKIFNKILAQFDDYDRLDRARDMLYDFTDIIETYKQV